MSSETSAIRTQTPGNYPKRNKLRDESYSHNGYQLHHKQYNIKKKLVFLWDIRFVHCAVETDVLYTVYMYICLHKNNIFHFKPDVIFTQTRYVQLAVFLQILHISIFITDPSCTLQCVCFDCLIYKLFKVARFRTSTALSFISEINSRPQLPI